MLTNPDGRLRFPEANDTTVGLTLPTDGSWVPFQISGEKGSATTGDAVIEAHCNTASGAIVGKKEVTVFWFGDAKMQLTQGGNYALLGGAFSVVGGVAVSFSAQATIKPAGVDCTAPQVKDLRIGIMQESSAFQIISTWDAPVIAPGTPSGTSVVAPMRMRQTIQYASSVAQPVNDGLTAAQEPPSGAYPLYSRNAVKPPVGCAGGSAATSSDTPGQAAPSSFSKTTGGVPVIWTNLVSTVRKEHFRTFCVVFNTVTSEYCALRQATWSVDVDSSGPAAAQHAVVNADGPVTSDPATGVQANNAPNSVTEGAVEMLQPAGGLGTATTTLTQP